MEIYCHFCGLSKFRTSRFRRSDLSHSLLLQFPVRCLNCGQRTYASLSQFRKLRSARKTRRKENRGTN
jgi:hypothetical protein